MPISHDCTNDRAVCMFPYKEPVDWIESLSKTPTKDLGDRTVIPAKIGGVDYPVFIDSGATVNIMRVGFAAHLATYGFQILTSTQKLSAFNGAIMPAVAEMFLPVWCGPSHSLQKFYVVSEAPYQVTMSHSFLFQTLMADMIAGRNCLDVPVPWCPKTKAAIPMFTRGIQPNP